MNRFIILFYGIISYIVGLGGLFFFVLFVGGWDFLPLHIDSNSGENSANALLINVGLIALFALQHSIMARSTFKNRLIKIIPKSVERSSYVLLSGILMIVICLFWQPLEGNLWQIDNPLIKTLLIVAYLAGWTLAVLATFMINHFELFGLQQVYFNLKNKPEPTPWFTERFVYKIVRHPLQLGVLIGIWSTPTMSMTHLSLSVTMSIYIFIGLYFEEKDLLNSLGQDYADYKTRVPQVFPIVKRSSTHDR